jgi:hypothetical protein
LSRFVSLLNKVVDQALTETKMISNMVGIAAGLEISKALQVPVGPGQANWAAASYPSVPLSLPPSPLLVGKKEEEKKEGENRFASAPYFRVTDCFPTG